MRYAKAILTTFAFALAFTSAVGADPTSEARKAITVIYEKRTIAAAHKDVDGVSADCTPDFVAIRTNGKEFSLAQVRENLQKIYQAMQDIKATTTIQEIRVTGNSSIVTAVHHISAKLMIPRTHTTKLLVETEVYRETWIKAGNGWREKHTQELSTHMTLDGKPFKSAAG